MRLGAVGALVVTALAAAILLLALGRGRLLSEEEVRGDARAIAEALRAVDAHRFPYAELEGIEREIEALKAAGPLSSRDMLARTQRIVALLNEGHASVLPGGLDEIRMGLDDAFLPFTVRMTEEGAVVDRHWVREGLFPGDVVVSIDGVPVSDLMAELRPLVPTDGHNETSFEAWAGRSLPLFLYVHQGGRGAFDLVALDGSNEPRRLRVPAIRGLTVLHADPVAGPLRPEAPSFGYEYLGEGIAYLEIGNFHDLGLGREDDEDFDGWYQDVFGEIKDDRVTDLILDLQRNGGGYEGNENQLFGYLVADPIRKYDAVTLPVEFKHRIQSWIDGGEDWRVEGDVVRAHGPLLMSSYDGGRGYDPVDPDLVYEGRAYLLTSGRTFSGGAEFASLFAMADRGPIIGEEAGGTMDGNVSGISHDVRLPDSGLRLFLPLMHFDIAAEPHRRGAGVLPDVVVRETRDSLRNGTSMARDTAVRLAKGMRSGDRP